MIKYENCGYLWADWDENDNIISKEYCHWTPRAPDDVAPCDELEMNIPDDYWGEEDEGDDIQACMRDSLGGNWW